MYSNLTSTDKQQKEIKRRHKKGAKVVLKVKFKFSFLSLAPGKKGGKR